GLVGARTRGEGARRPQPRARSGRAVAGPPPVGPRPRADATRRRLAFDADRAGFARGHASAEDEVRARLARTRPATVPDALLVRIGAVCGTAGVDGLRADLVISRAAAGLAGFEERGEANADDVRRVAPMALAHRQRRAPFDELHARGLDEALAALDDDDQPEDDRTGHDDAGGGDRTAQADRPPERVVPLRAARAPAGPAGRRSPSAGSPRR